MDNIFSCNFSRCFSFVNKSLRRLDERCFKSQIEKKMSLLEIKNLNISYKTRKETIVASSNVNFTLERGEILGIVGESGSGKGRKDSNSTNRRSSKWDQKPQESKSQEHDGQPRRSGSGLPKMGGPTISRRWCLSIVGIVPMLAMFGILRVTMGMWQICMHAMLRPHFLRECLCS